MTVDPAVTARNAAIQPTLQAVQGPPTAGINAAALRREIIRQFY